MFAGGHAFGFGRLDTLKLEAGSGFRNYTRMTPTDLECLLQMIGVEISKKHEIQSVPPSIGLAATLCFLANGDSFISWTNTFGISKQSKLGHQSVAFLVQLNDSNAVFHSQRSHDITFFISTFICR